MKGYHAFELNNEPGEWFEIELLVQLLSILYWKQHSGEIGLIANEQFIDVMKKYDMDSLYDSIDILKTEKEIDKSRFWAMPKIYVHNQIPESEYVLLDTDVFLREFPILKPNLSYVSAHCEYHQFKSKSGEFIYPLLSDLLSGETLKNFLEYDEVMPTNTSFLYCNDKELIQNWANFAIETAINCSKNKNGINNYGEMVTIEQRFLPIITRMLNKRYSVLISNVYNPTEQLDGGNEWDPIPSVGGNILEASKWYFHLWGFKKQLSNNIELRNYILDILLSELKQNFESSYNLIMDKFTKIKNQI